MRPRLTVENQNATLSELVRSLPSITTTTTASIDGYRVFRIKNSDKELWKSDEGKVLFLSLYALTRLGFRRDESPALEKDTRNHIEACENLYLVLDTDQIIAFAVFNHHVRDSSSILYLSGIMVTPKHQGQNISSALLKAVLVEFSPNYLVARTQNPVMYRSIARTCKVTYPVFDSDPPCSVIEVGKFVALKMLKMKKYNPYLMVGQNAYSSCLYGVEPVCQNTPIEQWFKERVNLQRGDAMIVVGVV